jgi:hypothetical protein
MKSKKILAILTIGVLFIACKNEPVEIKNEPPTCYVESPVNNATLLFEKNDTVRVQAYDLDGFIISVKLLVDNTEYGIVTSYPFEFILQSGKLSLGKHSIIAIAIDDKGKETKDSIDIEVVNTIRKSTVSCKITSPENNSYFSYNEDFNIQVSAEDSVEKISNVKLFIDDKEFMTLTASPYIYTVLKESLEIGQHKLVAIAINQKGEEAKDSINLNIFKESIYSGHFTFVTKSLYWFFTSYSRDTTIYNGKIDANTHGVVSIQYKIDENIEFTMNDDGTFISEGDWYYGISKKGGFIGLDSVSFEIQKGTKSGVHISVEGKRNY